MILKNRLFVIDYVLFILFYYLKGCRIIKWIRWMTLLIISWKLKKTVMMICSPKGALYFTKIIKRPIMNFIRPKKSRNLRRPATLLNSLPPRMARRTKSYRNKTQNASLKRRLRRPQSSLSNPGKKIKFRSTIKLWF